MSNTKWIKAKDIMPQSTVIIARRQVKVLTSYAHGDEIIITTEERQTYSLKAWQDVEVLCEQKGQEA